LQAGAEDAMRFLPSLFQLQESLRGQAVWRSLLWHDLFRNVLRRRQLLGQDEG
jgi:hypothetical protein